MKVMQLWGIYELKMPRIRKLSRYPLVKTLGWLKFLYLSKNKIALKKNLGTIVILVQTSKGESICAITTNMFNFKHLKAMDSLMVWRRLKPVLRVLIDVEMMGLLFWLAGPGVIQRAYIFPTSTVGPQATGCSTHRYYEGTNGHSYIYTNC